MLDMVLYFVAASRHDDGMAHLTPRQFSYEGVFTMNTTELMVCFVVLGKRQWVYLRHSKNNRGTANLDHRTLRGERLGTTGAFKPVFGIVVLGNRQQEVVIHVKGCKPVPSPIFS